MTTLISSISVEYLQHRQWRRIGLGTANYSWMRRLHWKPHHFDPSNEHNLTSYKTNQYRWSSRIMADGIMHSIVAETLSHIPCASKRNFTNLMKLWLKSAVDVRSTKYCSFNARTCKRSQHPISGLKRCALPVHLMWLSTYKHVCKATNLFNAKIDCNTGCTSDLWLLEGELASDDLFARIAR